MNVKLNVLSDLDVQRDILLAVIVVTVTLIEINILYDVTAALPDVVNYRYFSCVQYSVSRVIISYWKKEIHIVHASDLEFLIFVGRVPLWTFL